MIIPIFSAFTAGSLILLAFLFFANVSRVNVAANRWLAAFYMLLGFFFCQRFMDESSTGNQMPLLVHLLELTRWMVLPCFYIALLYFVNPAAKSRMIYLHFLPALAFFLFSLIFIIPNFSGADVSAPELPSAISFVIRNFFLVQAVAYWLMACYQLYIHSKNIRLIISSIENIDLAWIRYILAAMLVMTLLRLGRGSFFSPEIASVAYFILVCFIGYFSLRQQIIYPVEIVRSKELELVLDEKRTHERLTKDQVDTLKKLVVEITEARKLYLDPSLNLPALSKETGINTHELSYILNTGLDRNFYQFINEMRVEEAKRLLRTGKAKQLDMVGIAIQSGFNSKTTFNTTFKKLTGQTPTGFLKQV